LCQLKSKPIKKICIFEAKTILINQNVFTIKDFMRTRMEKMMKPEDLPLMMAMPETIARNELNKS